MMNHFRPLFICLVFLVLQIIAFGQVVERHYFSDGGIIQSEENITQVVRDRDKFIICGSSAADTNSTASFLREIDTSGKEIWTLRSDLKIYGFTSCQVFDGAIYVIAASSKNIPYNGTVLCDSLWKVDESTGNILWKISIPINRFNFCNFTNNRLFFSKVDTGLVNNLVGTIDKNTGKILSTKPLIFNGYAGQIYNDGKNNIYSYGYHINDSTNYVFKLDTSKLGDTIWMHSNNKTYNSNISGLLIDSLGYLYPLTGTTVHIAKLNPKTGSALWEHTLPDSQLTTILTLPDTIGKYLYVANSSTASFQITITKLELDSFKTIWKRQINIDPTLLHLKNLIINGSALDENGNIYMGICEDTAGFNTNYLIKPGIAKISGIDASIVYIIPLKSPTLGENYFPGTLYFQPYDNKLFILSNPNVIPWQEMKDSFYLNDEDKIDLFAEVDTKTGGEVHWQETAGPLRLTSESKKFLQLNDGNHVILVKEGLNVSIKKYDVNGDTIWTRLFLNSFPYDIEANANSEICFVQQPTININGQPGFVPNNMAMEVYKIGINGKIIFRTELEPTFTGTVINFSFLTGSGTDFYMYYNSSTASSYGTTYSSQVLKIFGDNTSQIIPTGLSAGNGSTVWDFSADSLFISNLASESFVDKMTLKSRNFQLPGYADTPISNQARYITDTAIYYAGVLSNLGCSNKQMTKIYWGKWVDTIPIVSKILPGGGNYLFAVGGSGGIGNDSLVEVVKFNSKNGKIAWTRIIQSKFGLKDIYTSCVSDTINRRIYIGGAVSLDATLKNTAAALWILNYNGTVLDTFYDKGTFPSNNKVNDLLALPNGDVLIAGQVSYNDYQAATLYRYHYTTHKIIDGNITKNDKATPLANTKVYAVSFSAKDSSLHAVDSTISDIKGSYILPVPDTLTNVYVKAAPSLSSYPNQMPTYADSSLFFRNAAVVKMVNDTEYKNFSTILGINPGGNGFIRGLISQGANKVGDPIEHIQVFLMNNNNVPIVSAVTNTSGNFSCADLPIETYKIFVDVPTVDNTRPPVITLTPKDSDMSKLTFLLHRNYLELVKSNGINETSAPENDFNIYPNPFNNQINITYHLSQRAQVSIDLINMQTGSIVKELENNTLPAGEYNKSYNLSSAGLAPGLYILKLMAGDRSSFQIMEKL